MATVFLCPNCNIELKPPGHMGRSWCIKCESYLVPILEQEEEGGELERSAEGIWVYTSWNPKPHNVQIDERVGHQFAYTKRRDRLSKGVVQFRGRCTCKQLKEQDWVSSKRRARIQWQRHMDEVETQQVLPV